MHERGAIDWIAAILVVIGAINWGLVVFDFNLVATLFGISTVAKIIYALVGLSGLWMLYDLFK